MPSHDIKHWQQGATHAVPAPPIGELESTQIDHLLQTEVVGRIGCHADGITFVVPITYVYAGGCIYGHTVEGTKTRMLRANPEVCFEVDHVDGLTDWQSVIAWGRFEELYDVPADDAMRLLFERLKQYGGPMTYLPPHEFHSAEMLNAAARGEQVVVYRIKLTKRTGRFQQRVRPARP